MHQPDQERFAALAAALIKTNHDLRNALSTAVMAGDRLKANTDPFSARVTERLIQSIQDATTLLSAAIRYTEKDAARPDVSRFSIKDFAAELEAENAVADPIEIEGDRDRLKAAVAGVIINAKEAGATTVRINAGLERGRVVLDISDDGPGLSAAAQEKIFTPLLTARDGHIGLGLVIARLTARAHGGDLRLVETGANGTTFRFELPDSPPEGARFLF
jgi:signal transduction histidine kinase